MTFDEFCEFCSCDMDEVGNKTQVLVIFSMGTKKKFSKEFCKANEEVSKRLTMHQLYDYLKEQFSNV